MILVVAVAALIASCATASSEGITSPGGITTTSTTEAISFPPAIITAVPTAGAVDVSPEQVVTVTVTDGTLDTLDMSAPYGSIPGTTSADDTTWTSTVTLRPSTTYQIKVTTRDAGGLLENKAWSFTTAAPTEVFRATISPTDNQVVGVGMPIIVTLSKEIPEDRRAEFINHLSVTSTPAVEGAWRWFSPKVLHWRPAEYWPAGTQVQATAAIEGFHAGNGAWGAADVTVNYRIGDSHVSIVDAATYTMTVTSNGEVVNTFPMSAGKPGYDTRSGIHVINEKQQLVIMDSATVGTPRNSPEGYYLKVNWAARISNSGEYVHSAPWSVGSQGRANVSHGCVNLSDANAKWFFEFSQIGDVVEVVNTARQLEPTNGIGDWQIPWAEWAN